MIKLIGFDLDDTLWDVAPVIVRAESKLDDWLTKNVANLEYSVISMRQFHSELLEEQPALKGQITELRRQIILRAMQKSNVTDASDLTNEAIEVFLKARNEIRLFEGAENILKQLSTKITLCALSNGNADIKRLGLDKVFSFAFSAEQVGAPKPASNLFMHALEKQAILASEMIYVGDDPILDIDAAAKLGIKTILFDRGRKPIGNIKPTETIRELGELIAAVINIQKASI